MAKRVKPGDLDENLIIQSFKDNNLREEPVAGNNKEDANASGENAPVTKVEPTEAQSDPARRSRRKRGTYDEVYLKKKDIKSRQPVYISQEVHREIKRVVNLLDLNGKSISVGGYIDNVLNEHLEQFKDEIAELRKQINENQ